MDELRALVDELEAATEEKQIEKKLQEIGAMLITQYEIRIDNLIIEPLWVEAYYYNKKTFPDCNTHLNSLQKNRFGQLYFHRTGHGGLDICLSTSPNSYLSFLLKATLIKGKFNTQTGLSSLPDDTGKTREELECIQDVLYKRDKILQYDIEYAARVRIVKPCYQDAKLAAFPFEELSNSNYDFSFAHRSLAPLAEKTIREYKEATNCTKTEGKNKCKELFGWIPDKINDIFKE